MIVCVKLLEPGFWPEELHALEARDCSTAAAIDLCIGWDFQPDLALAGSRGPILWCVISKRDRHAVALAVCLVELPFPGRRDSPEADALAIVDYDFDGLDRVAIVPASLPFRVGLHGGDPKATAKYLAKFNRFQVGYVKGLVDERLVHVDLLDGALGVQKHFYAGTGSVAVTVEKPGRCTGLRHSELMVLRHNLSGLLLGHADLKALYGQICQVW